jgi:polysaccharide biosynthesis/export protein
MRHAFVWLVALFAAGCAAPGQYPDSEMTDAENVTPITASLVREMAAAQAPSVGNPDLAAAVADWEYRVAPQDVLTIVIWNHPELTIPAGQFRSAAEAGHRVSKDGTIFYPYVGVIQVAGKTLAEIRSRLSAGLAEYIQNPQVDVRVAAFDSQRVHLVGEVRQPRIAPVSDVPLTVMQAIALAEGPTPEADLTRVAVIRDGERHELNIQRLLDYGDVSQDMLLRDGDIVQVPDRNRNKVYVLGEVREPQSLLMHRGRMTLAEAIADTAGFDPMGSDPSRIFVIRGDLDAPKVYWLDARSPDALLLAEHFPLEARDVVFVSTASVAKWSRVINQLAPTVRALSDVDDVGRR